MAARKLKFPEQLPFSQLMVTLRPADRIALHFFVDEIKKKNLPAIRNRNTDLSATILSYAGLIIVKQKPGFDKKDKKPLYAAQVTSITKRGMAFYFYMKDVEPLAELIKLAPYPFDRPKG